MAKVKIQNMTKQPLFFESAGHVYPAGAKVDGKTVDGTAIVDDKEAKAFGDDVKIIGKASAEKADTESPEQK